MNQQKLQQLKAAGGVAVELIEHIEYLQRTIDITNQCLKEKRDTIEYLKERVALMEGMIDEGLGWEDMERDL